MNAETRSVSSVLPMIFLKPNKCNVRFCATDELGKKEEEIGTYDWVHVAMTGTGKKQTKKRADSCLSACWSKQFRLSCYWIPPPSPMLLVSCRFLPFDVKVLTPFHFDSHEVVPSIHFESLHISAAEQRCRVNRRIECPSLTSIVVIFFPPKKPVTVITHLFHLTFLRLWVGSAIAFDARWRADSQQLLQFEENENK